MARVYLLLVATCLSGQFYLSQCVDSRNDYYDSQAVGRNDAPGKLQYRYDDYDYRYGANKPADYQDNAARHRYAPSYASYDNYADDEMVRGDKRIEAKSGYHPSPPKEKVKYVPVVVKKKKKKQKILSISKGVFIAGGTQVFGKFKSLKACMKACGATGSCFAGDYNPWLGKCYFHSNITACDTLRSHTKITHFKKVPCTLTDAPTGVIVIGAGLVLGVEQKGIDDLSTCIKKCANAGGGIAASVTDLPMPFAHHQICFAIDFDFATHKCYFHNQLWRRHVGLASHPLCATNIMYGPVTPIDLLPNPSGIYISFCPPALAGK